MILSTNSNEFRAALKKYRNATDQPAQKVIKGFMRTLLETVCERTPISEFEREDPGRLRGSWTISRDHPGAFMVPKGQTSSTQAALDRASSIQFTHPYAPWYLYNRVEYGVVVEYGLYPGNGPRTSGGYSTQAPEGMLRITMAEAAVILEEMSVDVRS